MTCWCTLILRQTTMTITILITTLTPDSCHHGHHVHWCFWPPKESHSGSLSRDISNMVEHRFYKKHRVSLRIIIPNMFTSKKINQSTKQIWYVTSHQKTCEISRSMLGLRQWSVGLPCAKAPGFWLGNVGFKVENHNIPNVPPFGSLSCLCVCIIRKNINMDNFGTTVYMYGVCK